MESEQSKKFFEEILSASSEQQAAPEPPSPEPVPEPDAPEQKADAPEKNPRKVWPMAVAAALMLTLLAAAIFLFGGSVQLQVISVDPQEGIFSGRDDDFGFFLVHWSGEMPQEGSTVRVQSYRREQYAGMGLGQELWAWQVKQLSGAPSGQTTLGTQPEQIWFLSLGLYPTQGGQSGVSVVTVPLAADQGQQLLERIDSGAWRSQEAELDVLFPAVGRITLFTDQAEQREILFAGDGQLLYNNAYLTDPELMYTMLTLFWEQASHEDRAWALCSWEDAACRWDMKLESDGTARLSRNEKGPDGSTKVVFVRKLHYVIVEDKVLMWPEDPDLQEMYAFSASREGLRFSAMRSHAEQSDLEDQMLFALKQHYDPKDGTVIRFRLFSFGSVSRDAQLTLEYADGLRRILQERQWETVFDESVPLVFCQLQICSDTAIQSLQIGADGFLYKGTERLKLQPDDWTFLMKTMYELCSGFDGGRYLHRSESQQADYLLELRSDGTYAMRKDGEAVSFGRYLCTDETAIFLLDGLRPWHLMNSGGEYAIDAAGIPELEQLGHGALFRKYAGSNLDPSKPADLPADGSQTVWLQTVWPDYGAEEQWTALTQQEIGQLNDLLQRRQWVHGTATAFTSPPSVTFKIYLGEQKELLESLYLGVDGNLYHDVNVAQLSEEDYRVLMQLLMKAGGPAVDLPAIPYEDWMA